jgi:hypothetical protein
VAAAQQLWRLRGGSAATAVAGAAWRRLPAWWQQLQLGSSVALMAAAAWQEVQHSRGGSGSNAAAAAAARRQSGGTCMNLFKTYEFKHVDNISYCLKHMNSNMFV